MNSFDFEAALQRLPRWIAALAVLGIPVAVRIGGLDGAIGFSFGALLAYLNYCLIERAVNRVDRLANNESALTGQPAPPKTGKATGVWMFIQFGILALLAFGILRFSGIHLIAALAGFLVCPAAVLVEILFELLTYGHS